MCLGSATVIPFRKSGMTVEDYLGQKVYLQQEDNNV